MSELNIRRTDLAVFILALLLGLVIGYAHLYLFPSELNPNFVTLPHLLDKGFILYKDIGDQKPPLPILLVTWLLPVFQGDAVTSARMLHLALIVFVVLFTVMWVNHNAGLWAAFFSGLFLLTWSTFFGLWATAYYDLIVTPIFLLSFALLVWDIPEKIFLKSLFTGLLTGVAFLIKQPAAFVGVFFLIWLFIALIFHQISLRKMVLASSAFLLGAIFPLLLYLTSYMIQNHTLNEVVFWNFSLLTKNQFAALAANPIPLGQLARVSLIMSMLAPFMAATFIPNFGIPIPRTTRLWLLIFLFAALLFQFPRYTSRHWSVAFPFAAMVSGIACADIIAMVRRSRIYLVLAIFLLAPLWWVNRAVLLYSSAAEQPNQTISEYDDLLPLAQKLQERIPLQGPIAIIPTDESNANLHYILQRDPPHYFIYHYPWFMNDDHIKKSWIESIEKEQIPVLLYFPKLWEIENNAPELIDYMELNYEIIDTVKWNEIQIQIMQRKSILSKLLN